MESGQIITKGNKLRKREERERDEPYSGPSFPLAETTRMLFADISCTFSTKGRSLRRVSGKEGWMGERREREKKRQREEIIRQ